MAESKHTLELSPSAAGWLRDLVSRVDHPHRQEVLNELGEAENKAAGTQAPKGGGKHEGGGGRA